MRLLELSGIKVSFGSREIRADFWMNEGERLALVGPSGAGKSSLVRLILGLLNPQSGTISYRGKDLTRVPVEKRNFGWVSQEPQLLPHLNVLSNILLPLQIRGRLDSKSKAKAQDYLDRLGLRGFESRDPSGLSGGEKQRVCVARALIFEPELLLFDEPFSGLDRQTQEEVRPFVLNALHQTTAALLLISHNQTEISEMTSASLRHQVDPDLRTHTFSRA